MTSIFAPAYTEIYDRIGQSAFSLHMASQVLAWIAAQNNSHSPRALRVLDLACGTGAAARIFAQAGCQVVGVDASRAMLDYARVMADYAGCSIIWCHQDMRWLTPASLTEQDVPLPFDLITCFNGLPYLRYRDDLHQICQTVARLLRPGGYWVFDLTDETDFTSEEKADRVLYNSTDYMVYQRLSYYPRQHQGRRRTAWFTREIDRWWRNEETHLEHYWHEHEVEAALAGTSPSLQIVMRLNAQRNPTYQYEPCTIYYVQSVDDGR